MNNPMMIQGKVFCAKCTKEVPVRVMFKDEYRHNFLLYTDCIHGKCDHTVEGSYNHFMGTSKSGQANYVVKLFDALQQVMKK